MIENIPQIESLGIAHARNAAHLQVITDTLTRVRKFNRPSAESTENQLPAKALAQYRDLAAKYDAEDQAYKATLGDDRSAQLKALDEERDQMQDTLRQMVNTYRKATWDPERQAAAELLSPVLKKYNVNTRLNYLEEGRTILQQNQELTGSMQYQKALTALGAKELVENLSKKSEELNALLLERNDDRSVQLTAELKTARQATDQSYRLLVQLLNAYALVDDDEERYSQLILSLNEDIKYYRQYVLKSLPTGDASSSSDDDSSSSDDDSGDDSSSDDSSSKDDSGKSSGESTDATN